MAVERIEVQMLSKKDATPKDKIRALHHVVFRSLNGDSITDELVNNAYETCLSDTTGCKFTVEKDDILKFDNMERVPELLYTRRAKTILWRIVDTFLTSGLFKQKQIGTDVSICGKDTFNYQVL